MPEYATRVIYGVDDNVQYVRNKRPEPGKPVIQRSMQNHQVQLNPGTGPKYSFVNGLQYVVTRVQHKFRRPEVFLGYSRTKARMCDAGHKETVGGSGVFYQKRRSEQDDRTLRQLRELERLCGFDKVYHGPERAT